MHVSRTAALGALVVLLATLGAATPALGQRGGATIAANSTVEGRLEQGDTRRDGRFVDTYIYDGEAGEELYLRSNQETTITGPNRFSHTINRFEQRALVRLPAHGTYRIAVAGSSDYELNLLQLNTIQNPTTLEVGQTINGAFSLDDSVDQTHGRRYDTYTYNATAGDVVGLLLQSVGTEAVLDLSPRPQNVFWFDSAPDYIHYTATGEYQVRVLARSREEAGNYTLTVVRGQRADSASPTGALALGETVVVAAHPGVLDEGSRPTAIYTMDARRGDRLAVMTMPRAQTRVVAPDGSGVAGQIETTGGASNNNASTFAFQAPADGQYRIQVAAASAGAPVSLRVLSATDGAAAIANWETNRIARIADLTRRGEQLLSGGASEDVTVVLREILSLDWTNPFANINLGTLEFRQGDLVDARIHFETALRADPNNQLAQNNLRLVQEAEAVRDRNWQLQQEESARRIAQWAAENAQAERDRQQREAAVLSNAIGTFTGAYNATVQAQQQADAQARAQAEAAAAARAQADANARAAQQQASAPAPTVAPFAVGSNNCASIANGRITNLCPNPIDVIYEWSDGTRMQRDTVWLAANASTRTGSSSRVLLSCNADGAQHGADINTMGCR